MAHIIRLILTAGLVWWVSTGSRVALIVALSLIFISLELAGFILQKLAKRI